MTDIGDLNLALHDLEADCVLLVKRRHDDPAWTATAISVSGAAHSRHGRGGTATMALINLVKACGK